MTSEGFNVDPHVKVLDESVVQRARERGLDALVYAPHFTRLSEIRARAERFSDDDLRVYPARELFTGTWQRRRHVLAVGLEEQVPDFLTLDGTMAELRRQEAAVLVPHPGFLSVSLGISELETYRNTIDAIETYNTKFLPHHTRRAERFARETDLPTFASSYAHRTGSIGEVHVSFDRSFDDAEAFAAALRDGEPRRIVHRDGVSHTGRRMLEFAHLGYENSWEKFDRVMLQGTAPTHPDHVAYDGQFDDVKVY
ncbi:PHP domain-containing protein [Halomicroarcula limicola]|uniref:PHP domain-containing protein n=1 Tax=Haloarcula limicola TaxID=1429915 RepID=A0A8J7Y3B2_9EURY|nr:PHP-associated domain-containing protein [Halomicroarcula limicola]MBV0923432.1 PHP domain-containing protein [Halomicroarcula limicola]